MQTNRPGDLPWDLEQAMTAFQVHPNWYEHYWLTPPKQRSPGLIVRIFRKTSLALREAYIAWRKPSHDQAFSGGLHAKRQ
jgi:hypothetical protein